MKNIVIDSNI